MFLRNYYNLMARLNLNVTKDTSNSGFGDGSLNIKGIHGGNIGYFQLHNMNSSIPALTDRSIALSDSDASYGIIFGTGNEPVKFNDYCLGTAITTGFSMTTVSVSGFSYNSELNKFNSTSKYTLSNSSESEVIIREYGIQLCRYIQSVGYMPFLIFRELLEPYALQPSESVNVILNASYTMPTIDESGNVVAGSQAYGLNIE